MTGSTAEDHYKRGIKAYVGDDIEGALKEFNTTKDYNPYYKSIDKKIRDLEEIQKLKKENMLQEKETGRKANKKR